MGVINPEGSQLNQPSCPPAKKNPLGRRGRALPSRLCLSRGGEEPLPSLTKPASAGEAGAPSGGCGTRAARRRSSLFAAYCVYLSQNTPRLCFQCVARSQQGPGRGGGALRKQRRGQAGPVVGGGSSESPHWAPVPVPPTPLGMCLTFSSDGPQPVQMSLPLTREGSPLCQAWLNLSTYGLAHRAVF